MKIFITLGPKLCGRCAATTTPAPTTTATTTKPCTLTTCFNGGKLNLALCICEWYLIKSIPIAC